MTQFKATFASQLHQAIPAATHQPLRVWASDESRFGLHTIHRRRTTAHGSKPIGIHQHRFENTWVFGAVEPTTGASHFMEFPTHSAAMVQRFLDDFARTYPTSMNLILMDNARTHTAKALVIPANVVLVFQPPYSPEVNPCERVWQAIKTAIAWEPFPNLDALRQRLVAVVRSYTDVITVGGSPARHILADPRHALHDKLHQVIVAGQPDLGAAPRRLSVPMAGRFRLRQPWRGLLMCSMIQPFQHVCWWEGNP